MNALFAQLVKQVLQAGLGTVSGSGAGDSSSYIGEIQAEARTGSADQVNSLRASTLNGMEVNLNNTYDYKAVRDSTLALVINAKERYEDVKACYVNKITDPKYSLSSSEKRDAQDEIDDVDQRIETRITPLASRYLLYAQDAETRLSILLDIKNKINLAQTVNDMNEPISKYGELVQSNSLTTFKEIVDAGEEKKEVQAQVSDMQDEAADMLRDCQVFPAGRF